MRLPPGWMWAFKRLLSEPGTLEHPWSSLCILLGRSEEAGPSLLLLPAICSQASEPGEWLLSAQLICFFPKPGYVQGVGLGHCPLPLPLVPPTLLGVSWLQGQGGDWAHCQTELGWGCRALARSSQLPRCHSHLHPEMLVGTGLPAVRCCEACLGPSARRAHL